MGFKPGERVVGRTRGTPNKATAKLRQFLDGVFEDAFASPEFKQHLVTRIRNGSIDTKLLLGLLAYYAGRPAQAFDHTHHGTVTLAQIIANQVPADDDEPDDDQAEDAPQE